MRNPSLKIIKAGWQGNPLDASSRFTNLEYPFLPKYRDVVKWMFSKNPQRVEKKQDTFRLTHIHDTSFLQHQDDLIIWLGHATFFIRLNGVSLLLDPVFYNVPLVKRYSAHA